MKWSESSMKDLSLEVQKLQDSIFVKKEEGTEVNYFLYPEFELHKNVLPAGVVQGWHAHSVVEEVIACTKGCFVIETIENQTLVSTGVEQGDVVRVKNSIHRLTNEESAAAEFLVFRFVPDGYDKREIIKTDKREYTEREIDSLLKGQS